MCSFLPAWTKQRFGSSSLNFFCLSAENLVDGIYLMIQTLWFFQQLGRGLVFLNHSIPIKTIEPVLLLLALKHPSKKMSDSETVRPRESVGGANVIVVEYFRRCTVSMQLIVPSVAS